MKDGWAYVPGREKSSIVFEEFEVQLEKALEVLLDLWEKSPLRVDSILIDDSTIPT